MNRAPRCRVCARALPKSTKILFFGQQAGNASRHPGQYFTDVPTSRDDVGRFSNLSVVSVRRKPDRSIYSAIVWDGETYARKNFCTDRCAVAFAHAMAVLFPTYASPAYNKAVLADEAKDAK